MTQQTTNFRLNHFQHEVASAALTGVAVEEIDERVIGPAPLSEGEKTALRLFAYSFLSRVELRQMALERLRRVSVEQPTA